MHIELDTCVIVLLRANWHVLVMSHDPLVGIALFPRCPAVTVMFLQHKENGMPNLA